MRCLVSPPPPPPPPEARRWPPIPKGRGTSCGTAEGDRWQCHGRALCSGVWCCFARPGAPAALGGGGGARRQAKVRAGPRVDSPFASPCPPQPPRGTAKGDRCEEAPSRMRGGARGTEALAHPDNGGRGLGGARGTTTTPGAGGVCLAPPPSVTPGGLHYSAPRGPGSGLARA